ncbi:unnamed protein product [Hermetia illucens]|uniref:Nuclear nucleic acid-binding protein C1D n=1 Tax=Hermetia illucens TaxID=343691 RepID=A0A7R8V2A2_HERIL|nr:nuclear nucleic acid-binding protein C1D [Hermetia illucens]CAD7091535.1 unnamed protein product [Hermetia illucens]
MGSEAIDFGELKNDTNFVNKVTNISATLDKIEESIQQMLEVRDYERLSTQEKVKYDLYLSYAINSLYWMYVKIQGMDPNNHDIKHELSRVRQAMMRDKALHDRNTIRPVLDQGAAGRFIRHGLHKKRQDDENQNREFGGPSSTLKNKHKRFDD